MCYASELVLRVLAFGLKGFTKPWIIFDSILVIIGSIFYIVSYSTDIALDPGASSSLRIIRIARVSLFHHETYYGKSVMSHSFTLLGASLFPLQRFAQSAFKHDSVHPSRQIMFQIIIIHLHLFLF